MNQLISLLIYSSFLLSTFAIVLFFNRRYNSVANKILAVMLILFGCASFIFSLDKLQWFPSLCMIDYMFVFVIPPFLYFYSRAYLRNRYVFHKLHLLHFIPFIIEFVIWYFHIFSLPLEEKKTLIYAGRDYSDFYTLQREILMLIIVISYSYLIIKDITNYKLRAKDEYSYTHPSIFKWFYIFILLLLSIGGLTSLFTLFADNTNKVFNFSIILNISFILIILIIFLRPEIYQGIGILAPIKLSRRTINSPSTFSTKDKEALFKKLQDIMALKKPFLDPKLTIKQLADLLNTNSKYLSMTINGMTNTSFFDFVNSYRIIYAKEMLEKKSSTYTIETISKESGFNSASTFYKFFKRTYNMTPTEYLKSYTKLTG